METTSGVTTREEAVRLLKAGQSAEAIAIMETMLESTPDDHELHTLLGVAFHQTGDISQSIHHLEESVRIVETAKGYYNLGQAYEQVNRIDDATRKYRMAVALDSSYDPAKQALNKLLEKSQPKPQVTTAVPTTPPIEQTQAMSPSPPQDISQTQVMPPPAQNAPDPLAYQLEQQRKIQECRRDMIKSGLIYGIICGPLIVLFEGFVLTYFGFLPLQVWGTLGIVCITLWGALYGGFIGMWVGHTCGGETAGMQAGAVIGAVMGIVLGMIGGSVAGILMYTAALALAGTGAGMMIGRLVDASIGQV